MPPIEREGNGFGWKKIDLPTRTRDRDRERGEKAEARQQTRASSEHPLFPKTITVAARS